MNQKKNIFGILLLAAVGIIFIISAILKLYPSITEFEYIIKSQLQFSDSLTYFTSRFFIGLELALGFLLLFNFKGRKNWNITLSIATLILFSIHLLILLANTGNDVNCGCMGSLIKMNPIESILKNIGLIIMLILGTKWTTMNSKNQDKFYNGLSIGLIFAMVLGSFIAFPQTNKVQLAYHKMYDVDQPEQPKINLKEGKHIVCLMTLTCGHCKDAAIAIQEMLNQTGKLPFYFIFPEPNDTTTTEEKLFGFLEATKTYNVPFHFVNFDLFAEYVKATGNTGTPVILMMEDSTVIKEIKQSKLSVKEIEQWLNEKQ